MAEKDVLARVIVLFALIERAAVRHKLDPYVLAGLVCQESGGEPDAARPEPIYKWLFGKTAKHKARVLKLLPQWRTLTQDYYMQKISYGLCQVMGAVAREVGLEGYLTRLCPAGCGAALRCQDPGHENSLGRKARRLEGRSGSRSGGAFGIQRRRGQGLSGQDSGVGGENQGGEEMSRVWAWIKKNPGKAVAITAVLTGSAGLSVPAWVPQVFNILMGGGQ